MGGKFKSVCFIVKFVSDAVAEMMRECPYNDQLGPYGREGG